MTHTLTLSITDDETKKSNGLSVVITQADIDALGGMTRTIKVNSEIITENLIKHLLEKGGYIT